MYAKEYAEGHPRVVNLWFEQLRCILCGHALIGQSDAEAAVNGQTR